MTKTVLIDWLMQEFMLTIILNFKVQYGKSLSKTSGYFTSSSVKEDTKYSKPVLWIYNNIMKDKSN